MADQTFPWSGKSYLLVTFLFLPKFGFLSHNCGSRNARKPIKPSKDSEYSLVSPNKFELKNGTLGWSQGPDKLGQKGENLPQLWHHPQKTPQTQFLKNLNYKTSSIPRGFEQLFTAQSPGYLWCCKIHHEKWRTRVLKGTTRWKGAK